MEDGKARGAVVVVVPAAQPLPPSKLQSLSKINKEWTKCVVHVMYHVRTEREDGDKATQAIIFYK